MSYTDLSTMKKINGFPADIRFFEELNENDAFLKNIADNDENLEALDRNILPVLNNTFNLGSLSNRFLNTYSHNVISDKLSLGFGTLLDPSLKFNLSGFVSLNSGELSFVSNNLEAVRLMSSGLEIKAANNAQLKLENTLPGSFAKWSIGSEASGLSFTDIQNSSLKLKLGINSVDIKNRLSIPNGTELSPSIFFGSDLTTGFYKDSGSAVLKFSISGVNKASISSSGLELLSGKLTLPMGTAAEPSITFDSANELGFSALDNDNLILSISGNPLYKFSNEGISSEIQGNSFLTKRVFSDIGLSSWHTDLISLANGTKATPLPLTENQEIYFHAVEGYTDTGWQRVSEILVQAQENYDGGSYGAAFVFSTTPVGQVEPIERLSLGKADSTSLHIPQSIGFGKMVHSTAGLNQQIDVSEVSKLMIDATAGNIEIKGFIGGKEGQMLYIYKKVPNNTFTILFNSVTATQKVLLKGSTNFVNTNDYGGITLSFDDGVWREVSRS